MNFSIYAEQAELEAFLSYYLGDLVRQYNEEVDMLQAEESYKSQIRNSDECFNAYVIEQYFAKLEAV